MSKIKGIVSKKLGRRNAHGLVEDGGDMVFINARLKSKKKLEIIINECRHINLPYLMEATIEELGSEIARTLWDFGYRKVDNDISQPLQDESKPEA